MSNTSYLYPTNGKRSSESPLTEEDYLKIKEAASVLRSVNHSLRQKILQTIYKHKRISVTELYTELGLEQSVASQHLAILRESDIVNTIREGKFIYYTVNTERLEHLEEFIKKLVH